MPLDELAHLHWEEAVGMRMSGETAYDEKIAIQLATGQIEDGLYSFMNS